MSLEQISGPADIADKNEEIPAEKERKTRKRMIEELKQPTQSLLEQIKESIDQGAYKYIIGDDASGRIPALIFDKVIRSVYEEKGFEKPKVLFIAGSRPDGDIVDRSLKRKKDRLQLYIDDHISNEGSGKVLIVTEYISTGSALAPLAEVLTKKGIKFDIVSIGSYPLKSGEFGGDGIKEKLKTESIFAGQLYAPSIYSGLGRKMSGVEKNPEDVVSVKINQGGNVELQQTINDARADVAEVANDLIKWYKNQTEKK